MNDSIQALQASTLAAIAAADDDRALDEVRVSVLGKKGSLTTMAAGLRDLPPDQKPLVGQWLNAARTAITDAFSVFAAPSGTSFYRDAALEILDTGSVSLVVNVISTGANISALTAGSVDIWIRTSVLP